MKCVSSCLMQRKTPASMRENSFQATICPNWRMRRTMARQSEIQYERGSLRTHQQGNVGCKGSAFRGRGLAQNDVFSL